MAQFFEELNDQLRELIAEQHVFFVATAPAEGRISLSPKGMDTFRCLDARRVAYLDITGSGNETAAHLHENGRVTLMFCSFGPRAKVLRLYGRGCTVGPRDEQWDELCRLFPNYSAARQVMVIDIQSVQTSCGYGVPLYEFKGERDTLERSGKRLSTEQIAAYWDKNNLVSIDGLPTGMLPSDGQASSGDG